MNEIIDIFNKHNYLGEHGGKANILLSSTVDGVFSITLEDEDEDNGFKSSWEMTMHRDAAEKVARKFAEMLGIIPIERKNERRCGMINARTTSSQILIEEMEPTKINAPTVEPARLQGEWIPIKMRPGTDEEYEEYYCMMDLDEDEMYRILTSKDNRCPYYRQGDEYYLARRQ